MESLSKTLELVFSAPWDSWRLGLSAGLEALFGIWIGLSLAVLGSISYTLWTYPNRTRRTWIFYLVASLNLFIFIYLGSTFVSFRLTTLVQDICDAWTTKRVAPISVNSTDCERIVGFPARNEASLDMLRPLLGFQIILTWISNGVVAFRAGALTQSRIIHTILSILWVLGTVAGILVLLSSPDPAGHYPVTGLLTTSRFARVVATIFVCLSYLSNLVATGMFGWSLWKHRRYFKAMRSLMKTNKLLAQEIFALIIESGVVYSFWALQSTFTVVYLFYAYFEGYPLISYAIWQAIYIGYTGMYPAFLFLIASGQKFWIGKF